MFEIEKFTFSISYIKLFCVICMIIQNDLFKISKPIMYVDRLRIRNPGDNAFFEPPHLNQGNVERWSDKTYRKVYRKILEDLDMESYDPFEIDYR